MSRLTQRWYQGHLLFWLLWPLSVLFVCMSAARRLAFRLGLKASTYVDAKVIVVGNLSVGGNGKTPTVIALAMHYHQQGRKVGILSRGYGGSNLNFPRQVLPGDPATEVGDEPLLMATRTGLPVVIDPKRGRGAQYLVRELQCDVIICDDGLQHYALARDAEVVVMDERGVGSGHLLPMGPLREGRWRLNHVDAVIHNTTSREPVRIAGVDVLQVNMQLTPGNAVNVKHPRDEVALTHWQAGPVTAVAGIGNPQRFFRQLESLGLSLKACKSFNDHHQFSPQDIPRGTVMMTEKDAVKVTSMAHDDCWFLPVTASLPDALYKHLDAVIASTNNKRTTP